MTGDISKHSDAPSTRSSQHGRVTIETLFSGRFRYGRSKKRRNNSEATCALPPTHLPEDIALRRLTVQKLNVKLLPGRGKNRKNPASLLLRRDGRGRPGRAVVLVN